MRSLSAGPRRYLAGLLGVLVLAALWTTGLARISDSSTAVPLLTDAGAQLVNPLLVANGSGISQGTYQQLERDAAAHPTQPLQILFLKPTIVGHDIAGKTYPQALQVIFGKVAEAYYAGGPGAAFTLPPQLQSAVGNFTPLTQLPTQLPGIPQSPLPQLPSFAAPLFTHVGLTPATLTADGHNGVVSLTFWLWLACAVLGALVALLGVGWARLSTLGWSVFHSAWHITLLLMIAAFLVSRNPSQAAPYRDVLGLIGGAFFPLYAAATVAGLAGVGVAFVATHLKPQGARSGAGPEPQAGMISALRAAGYPIPQAGQASNAGQQDIGYPQRGQPPRPELPVAGPHNLSLGNVYPSEGADRT